MKSIVIGTAGHIDHGKSTLVKALTGTDPDRLKEEKERGITIDIGFASLQLDPGVQVGFIDVPGHERFIKNMLAGVGGIDAVILVVAADESIMPQTREHFDICKLLEVPAGIAVITKSDLVDSELLELVRSELAHYLRNSFLEGAPMIAVSAQSGIGLDDLRLALLDLAGSVPRKSIETVFRLPVDRCFSLHGFGTIVTGTVLSGMIQKDQEVEIYPTGRKVRVRNLQVYGQTVKAASAGQRAALNLSNVQVDEIQRGMELSVSGRFIPVTSFEASIHLLAHSPVALKKQSRVRVHHGTSEVLGFVSPIGSKELGPGESCFARLRLESPILAIPGDPFIIRRTSPMVTIGGGRVVNSLARLSARYDSDKATEELRTFESGDLKDRILGLARRSLFAGVEEGDILSQTMEPRVAVQTTLSSLAKSNQLKVLSEHPCCVMEMSSFVQLAEKALSAVKEFHQKEPLAPGILKGQLHSSALRLTSQTTFRGILDHLSSQDLVVIEQDCVRLRGYESALSGQESLAKHEIEQVFLAAGWKVPSLDEVLASLTVPKNQALRLVTMLTKEGKLIKISESLYFHASSISQLRDLLAEYRKGSDRIDVGAFKELTAISRRYAIPLLEYLDRKKITRRVGDYRLILVN
jgi:selenocysteine-specific elongation factor